MKQEKNYIKSPLNYIGGKYKILDSIIPELPENISTFVDLFGGGFNVGINVCARKIIYNDHIPYLKEMFQLFRNSETEVILDKIKLRISQFGLSEENQEGYISLRKEYNLNKNILDLFILTCYSFNHQIRFNFKHEFNTPFGMNRSAYNRSIENNLIQFIGCLKKKNIEFISEDFLFIKDYCFKENDFVYCDPPYLISNAVYNDGKRGFKNWTKEEDKKLLGLLDFLSEKNVRFMLSDVFVHKGLENTELIEWSKKYKVKYINKSYFNCSYKLKTKNTTTQEVVVFNY